MSSSASRLRHWETSTGSGKSSDYTGVSWHKGSSKCEVTLCNLQTKRRQFIGSYDSEEAAAMAYDWAVVQARGPEPSATSRDRFSPSR